MFDQLSDRLRDTLKRVRGQARLTEDNITDILREIRISLLGADVSLPVVKKFIEEVKQKALGEQVLRNLNPGQMFVKVVQQQLVNTMGEHNDALNLNARPPVVILLAGLQGAGKTTTAAKLANLLMTRENKKVMLVSADVYRPAAIEQLQTLANSIGAGFIRSQPDQKPVKIVTNALDAARKQMADVLIIDTAGRLHVDHEMMQEIKTVHSSANPAETLFVVDSMTGQDAVNSAEAFNNTLPLTGIVLTKTDGDARGGAALSIRSVTGKPIKFLGTGEKIDGLEAFDPERVASRILGMGDVIGLIEQAEQQVDHSQAKKLARKLKKGKGFDLTDYRDQLMQMQNMGGISSLLEKMPGVADLPAQALNQVDDRQFMQTVAIINSMTPGERTRPDIIKATRKRRIAAGSGTQVQDVNRLLKQFLQMQKMMKKMGKKGNMAKMMRSMGGKMPNMPF